ncbi:hypothetical protein [Noviherbaspirillum aerium]|uniref:hypothetical protein n=1 Tax=Noviherbaspirillum aerium TaxID=2588497 RepID=UPI00124D903F|nr:hypothetical protein [Noviherbaspirillum aerium]
MTCSERKKQLIAEGALHRAGMVLAKNAVSANAHPEAIVGSALQHLKASAGAFAARHLDNLSASDMQALAPIALPLLTRLLQNRNVPKALLGAAAAAGAAGYLFTRFKKTATARRGDAGPATRRNTIER